MKAFGWIAPMLAVLAIFFLPALEASAPLLGTEQWTVAELPGASYGRRLGDAPSARGRPSPGNEARPPSDQRERPKQKVASHRASLRSLLHQAQSLRQEFGGPRASKNSSLAWALALAGLIPAMAMLAGLCALLSLAWQAWGKRPAIVINAAVGLLATAYAIAASWWLTRVAHLEVAHAFDRAQRNLGSLLRGLDWKSVQASVAGPLGVTPEVGLYVLLLCFLAVLLGPRSPVREP